MDGFSQRALPVTFFPEKPKTIVAGITQEQLQVINQNTIPQPTTFGSEIQFYLPQLGNTFLDCATTYLLFSVVGQFVNNTAGATIYANQCNGAVLGSFYSFFQRLTVYANSVNVTDDINELGIVASYYLKLTMSRQARDAMAWLMGFNPDPTLAVGLTGFRVKGPFPMCENRDVFQYINRVATANGPGITIGLPVAPAGGRFNQAFHVAIPMIGSLGVNNPNMYYLGLGNTRISLFLDDPTNAFLLPPAGTLTSWRPSGATANTREDADAGGLTLSNIWITRARFIGNILRLDDTVMQQVIQLMQPVNGQQLVTKCTSFGVSTQAMPRAQSGLTQLAMNIRRGSVKSILVTFNNTGTCYNGTTETVNAFVTADGSTNGANIEIQNFFKKYGSVNPGLGANTQLLINNVNYPKLGLNPTQFPEETMAYILDGLHLLTSDDMKPSFQMANWLVCDPNVLVYQRAATITNAADPAMTINDAWRTCTYINTQQSIAAGPFAAQYAGCQLSRQQINAFIPQDFADMGGGSLGSLNPYKGESFVNSNEFFLYFNLEDQPRPGMISGKNTMDGSNFLSLNLITNTSYTYTVYMICLFDALLVHDFADRNVYYVS